MNVTNYQEIWQVDISGEIYEASFEIMAQWIYEGALLPQDKVRRGNLRWIEAQKVPSLIQFFNGKEQGLPPPVFSSTTDAQPQNIQPIQNETSLADLNTHTNPYQTNVVQPEQQYQTNIVQTQQNYQTNIVPPPTQNYETNIVQPEQNYETNIVQHEQSYETNIVQPQQNYETNFVNEVQPPIFQASQNPFHPEPTTPANACAMHPDAAIAYACVTCGNCFCPQCPKSFGGSVKICPFCGAMCEPLKKLQEKAQQAVTYQTAITKGFGFEDFANAIVYPFRYKTSLIAGAIMFMFFTLGQGAASFGMSVFLVGAAICCWMMANMLTFGVLANTVENFSQGKINLNFMPSFDDFSLWDDVVHPFFLCLGTYIVSFGFLFIFLGGLIYFTWSTFNGNAPVPMEKRIEAAQKDLQDRKDKVKTQFKNDNPELYPESDGEKEIEEIQKMVQEQRKKELESVAGKTPEQEAEDRREMLQNFKNLGIPAVGVAFLLLLWGVFYYPAACLVAGYTRSFKATLNPSIGWETIRILGWDYIKILLMSFILVAALFFVGVILGVIFYAFNLPGVGNLPAKAIGSLFGFYFSVVFAVVLGFALYKNAEKLRLFRN